MLLVELRYSLCLYKVIYVFKYSLKYITFMMEIFILCHMLLVVRNALIWSWSYTKRPLGRPKSSNMIDCLLAGNPKKYCQLQYFTLAFVSCTEHSFVYSYTDWHSCSVCSFYFCLPGCCLPYDHHHVSLLFLY